MKVFALTVLLISIYYVEGGLVKRQTEEEPQEELSSVLSSRFADFVRRLKQETEEFASSVKNSLGQPTVEEFRTQFETVFQQLQESLNPITEQVKQNVARLFAVPGQAQQATEEGA